MELNRLSSNCSGDDAIVSLLDSDKGDILEPDGDGLPINAIYKIPAEWYGPSLLLDESPK